MTPEEKSLSFLQWKNIVVYDLETQRLVGHEMPDGRLVKWSTPELMGISSGVLFDYETGDYHMYLEKDVPLLVERLNRAELIVGFNHKVFDNGLLRSSGHALKPEAELVQYDILEEVRRGLGGRPRGCSLDQCLIGTFGEKYKKNGHGEDAPMLYQSGRLGELLTYNCGDTRRTRLLFEHFWLHGWVSTPTNGKSHVAHPLKVWRAEKEKNGLHRVPQNQTGGDGAQGDLLAGAGAIAHPNGQPITAYGGGSSQNGDSQAGNDVQPGGESLPGAEGSPQQHHHQESELTP